MKFARPGFTLPCSLLLLALGGCTGNMEGDESGEPAGGSGGKATTTAGKGGGSAGSTSSGGGGTPAAGSGGTTSTAGSGGGVAGGASGSSPSPSAGSGGGGAAGTSPDAGVGSSPDADPPQPEPGSVQTIVVAGYAGRRTISRDRGKTWEPVQVLGGGGDDQFLLRDAAFGANRVVALGWKFMTSPDGTKWTEVKNPHGQWQGGVVWGNGMFISSGGLGRSAKSLDGVTWTTIANAGNTHIRRMSFSNGEFWATGDSGTVYHTADGVGPWKVGGSYPAKAPVADDLKARLSGGRIEVQIGGGAWTRVLDASWAMGCDVGYLKPPQ